MPAHILFNELTRDEARARAADTLLVLPTGATEQHGPHLPVGTDTFAVEQIARAAATRAADQIPVLVAPSLPFGSSHHHLPFGGTLSVGTETYYRLVCDLVESLIAGGFRRIFILNGHGGNDELVQLAARDLALKHDAQLAAASYWTIAWDALVQVQAYARGRLPGHAGAFETSVVAALRPDLVREPLPRRDDAPGVDPLARSRYRAEFFGFWQSIDGYTDSPARAEAEHGHAYLEAAAQAVADAFVSFYRQDLRGGASGAVQTPP